MLFPRGSCCSSRLNSLSELSGAIKLAKTAEKTRLFFAAKTCSLRGSIAPFSVVPCFRTVQVATFPARNSDGRIVLVDTMDDKSQLVGDILCHSCDSFGESGGMVLIQQLLQCIH